jgi:hypothetical protein
MPANDPRPLPEKAAAGSERHLSGNPTLSTEDDAAVLAKLGYKQELRRNLLADSIRL